MNDKWLSDVLSNRAYQFSGKDISRLKNFYMAQRALSVELQEAKPLGICRTNTSTKGNLGNPSISNDASKEMSC